MDYRNGSAFYDFTNSATMFRKQHRSVSTGFASIKKLAIMIDKKFNEVLISKKQSLHWFLGFILPVAFCTWARRLIYKTSKVLDNEG